MKGASSSAERPCETVPEKILNISSTGKALVMIEMARAMESTPPVLASKARAACDSALVGPHGVHYGPGIGRVEYAASSSHYDHEEGDLPVGGVNSDEGCHPY